MFLFHVDKCDRETVLFLYSQGKTWDSSLVTNGKQNTVQNY